MKPFNRKSTSNNRSSLALLLSLLHDLLDNLLFLNQERANHTVLDAVGTPGTTVGALDSLLWSGDAGVFARTQSRDTGEFDAAVTAFWCSALLLQVKISELASGSLNNADLVRLGVVRLSPTVGESV